MSPKLPRVKAGRVRRAIERDGWYRVRQVGSHATFKHPFKPGYVTLSLHAGDDVLPKTLASILDQAGLTIDEFNKLL